MAEFEEFQESEVIFHENAGMEENERYKSTGDKNINSNKLKRKKNKNKKKKKISAPVNIPEIASANANSWIQYVDSDFFEDEYYADDDGGITPPHVILSRRIAGKMAFSVCTGNGRTLKGRDLSEVRNCILRMTGFLEA